MLTQEDSWRVNLDKAIQRLLNREITFGEYIAVPKQVVKPITVLPSDQKLFELAAREEAKKIAKRIVEDIVEESSISTTTLPVRTDKSIIDVDQTLPVRTDKSINVSDQKLYDIAERIEAAEKTIEEDLNVEKLVETVVLPSDEKLYTAAEEIEEQVAETTEFTPDPSDTRLYVMAELIAEKAVATTPDVFQGMGVDEAKGFATALEEVQAEKTDVLANSGVDEMNAFTEELAQQGEESLKNSDFSIFGDDAIEIEKAFEEVGLQLQDETISRVTDEVDTGVVDDVVTDDTVVDDTVIDDTVVDDTVVDDTVVDDTVTDDTVTSGAVEGSAAASGAEDVVVATDNDSEYVIQDNGFIQVRLPNGSYSDIDPVLIDQYIAQGAIPTSQLPEFEGIDVVTYNPDGTISLADGSTSTLGEQLELRGTGATTGQTGSTQASVDAYGVDTAALLFEFFPEEVLKEFVKSWTKYDDVALALAETRTTEAWKKHFGFLKRPDGTLVMTEAEALAVKASFRETLAEIGITDVSEFEDDFNQMIGGETSAAEFQQRVDFVYTNVVEQLPEVLSLYGERYGIETDIPTIFGSLISKNVQDKLLRGDIKSIQIQAEGTRAGYATSFSKANQLRLAGLNQERARSVYQAGGVYETSALRTGRSFDIGMLEQSAVGDLTAQQQTQLLSGQTASQSSAVVGSARKDRRITGILEE